MRNRTGGFVTRGDKTYARVSYKDERGKRRSLWRRVYNNEHAKETLEALLAYVGQQHPQVEAVWFHGRANKTGYIYALRMQIPNADQPIKIGYSLNPKRRMRAIMCCGPYPIEVVAVWPTHRHYEEELEIHKRFAHLRLEGEWFKSAPELLDFIDTQAAPHQQHEARNAQHSQSASL